MRRLVLVFLLLPLLCAAAGAHPPPKATLGINYDRFPANTQMFVRTLSFMDNCTLDGQSGGASINTANYGGSGASNIFEKATTGVSGVVLLVRWACIEQSSGVFTWTGIDTVCDQVVTHGGKCALLLIAESTGGTNTRSWNPTDMASNTGTYGGASAHGGEVSNVGGTSWYPIIWNANWMVRYKAFIDAVATKYGNDSRVEFIAPYGETAHNYQAADVTAGGGATGFLANYETMASYATTKLSPKPAFLKMNFLPGDDGTQMAVMLAWAKSNGVNFSYELCLPTSGSTNSYKYPPVTGSCSSSVLDTSWATGQTFPSTQSIYANTEYTDSTWGTAPGDYTSTKATNILRYMAGLCSQLTTGTCYYSVTNTGGTGTGALPAMLPLITGRYLR